MIPEKEAREVLCCGPLSIVMEISQSADSFCLGSRCMAWRWADGETAWIPNTPGSVFPTGEGRRGYCGLAGNPRGVS